jgi:hypothetical protein
MKQKDGEAQFSYKNEKSKMQSSCALVALLTHALIIWPHKKSPVDKTSPPQFFLNFVLFILQLNLIILFSQKVHDVLDMA